MPPQRLRELSLACCLLLAAGLCVWLDRSSRIASALRSGDPVVALAALRFQGQDRVIPPALYLAVYAPASGALDLVLIPPSFPAAGDAGGAARTLAEVYGAASDPGAGGAAMADAALRRLQSMAVWPHGRGPDLAVSLELDADARPAYPLQAKKRLLSRLRDPFFWLRAGSFSRAAGLLSPAGPYDALVLARALRSLAPSEVRLSSLQDPELAEPWLGRVFAGEAGLPEASGAATVEVLNASGVPGVALRATKLLRLNGFDVVHFGNASATEASLSLTDRAGSPAAARNIAVLLGCPDLDVLTVMEERPRAAVLLELGRDFDRCPGLQERPGG